ncbi:dCMP deaminase family protein [Candidatus Uhrbacteria bacterium]|nr:dCMP deaminase family protein [Candidatus Uhrbacteria bacterium]
MNRPNWDTYFMDIANVVATRGTCDRAHVGAVIVKDRRIISTGYNGSPPGMDHCSDVGHQLEDGHCIRTLHGEENAILQAAVVGGSSTKGATLYTTHSTCYLCLKKAISVGITRIVAGMLYRDPTVGEICKKVGIELVLLEAKEGQLIDELTLVQPNEVTS